MSEKTSSAGAPVGVEAPPAVPARWSAGRKTGTPDNSPHEVVARRPPPLDRSSIQRVDGVESLQYMLNQVVSKTLTRPGSLVAV